MVGVSEYSHRVARPRFREDDEDEEREPREKLVVVFDVVLRPRPGVVRIPKSSKRRLALAEWAKVGLPC
jgi:hypothetical protein